jgi:hypothetical protein
VVKFCSKVKYLYCEGYSSIFTVINEVVVVWKDDQQNQRERGKPIERRMHQKVFETILGEQK